MTCTVIIMSNVPQLGWANSGNTKHHGAGAMGATWVWSDIHSGSLVGQSLAIFGCD
jgi:hypothetical protein